MRRLALLALIHLLGLFVARPNAAYAEIRYTLVDLGTLGGRSSSARANNSVGHVIGPSGIAESTATHAFFYTGGPLIEVGTVGGANSVAEDINDVGEIVGRSAGL